VTEGAEVINVKSQLSQDFNAESQVNSQAFSDKQVKPLWPSLKMSCKLLIGSIKSKKYSLS